MKQGETDWQDWHWMQSFSHLDITFLISCLHVYSIREPTGIYGWIFSGKVSVDLRSMWRPGTSFAAPTSQLACQHRLEDGEVQHGMPHFDMHAILNHIWIVACTLLPWSKHNHNNRMIIECYYCLFELLWGPSYIIAWWLWMPIKPPLRHTLLVVRSREWEMALWKHFFFSMLGIFITEP